VTPTPEEALADMLDKALLLDETNEGVWPTPQRIREWQEVLGDALAASRERVRELEEENVALRANASVSVVRRLVEQGALRGPSTAGAEGEQGLEERT